MTNELVKIGKNIKELRLEQNLSQQDLAELAGMSYKYLGEIERGQVNLSVEFLIKIAQALHVKAGDLLNDSVSQEIKSILKVKSIFSDLSMKNISTALDILKAFHKNMKK